MPLFQSSLLLTIYTALLYCSKSPCNFKQLDKPFFGESRRWSNKFICQTTEMTTTHNTAWDSPILLPKVWKQHFMLKNLGLMLCCFLWPSSSYYASSLKTATQGENRCPWATEHGLALLEISGKYNELQRWHNVFWVIETTVHLWDQTRCSRGTQRTLDLVRNSINIVDTTK